MIFNWSEIGGSLRNCYQIKNGHHFPTKEPVTALPHFRMRQNGYISSLLVYSQRCKC